MRRWLECWTVYHWAKDRPEEWSARKWSVSSAGLTMTDDMLTAPTLGELREQFEAFGLFPLARDPSDDPVIYETWI